MLSMWLVGRTGVWRALVAAGALLVVVPACSYTTDLSEPDRDPASSVILAADGSVITTLHAGEDREPVTLDEIAPALRDAVVAIEDERFYSHGGVDAQAVGRALVHDLGSGGAVEGGSTITQQYVRTALLDPDRTVNRKVREAVLAWQLERRLDKDEILERYLNAVYFGDGAYGAEAAARHYFDTSAAELTLAQSALLAGLLQAPEDYNPYVDPDAALGRRDTVLDKMLDQGMIDRVEHDAAVSEELTLDTSGTDGEAYPAPHFVDRVIDSARRSRRALSVRFSPSPPRTRQPPSCRSTRHRATSSPTSGAPTTSGRPPTRSSTWRGRACARRVRRSSRSRSSRHSKRA